VRPALFTLAFVLFVVGLMFGARYVATAPPSASTQSPAAGTRALSARAANALPPLFVYRDDAQPATIALAGPRAKPALLHLWATWCGPCRAELPELLERGRKGDLEVIAVSVDDYYKSVRLAFGGPPYHGKVPPEIVWDKTISLEKALRVGNIPTTFLVDTDGNVRERFDGAQAWLSPALQSQVTAALRD
jgi:thiol-disulfide isomerase/thioredoxin